MKAGLFVKEWIKKGIVFLVMPLMMACLSSTVLGQDAAASRKVRVGLFPFAGYYEVDAKTGLRSGYGYELLQLMGQHADLSFDYVDNVADWGEMEQMLQDGRIDMLTSVQKTPENEARFAFSDISMGTSSTLMTVKAGNNRLVSGEYATYSGARIGVIKDNAHAEKFAAFAEEHGFTYEPVEYGSLDELKAALQAGKIDACVTSNLRILDNEWIVEQFSPSPFYMMMRKDDAALIAMVNSALKQMDTYSPNWRTELFNKYYTPDSGDELQLSSEERAYISSQAQHVFRVAMCPGNAPYSYFEDGQVKGIIPEIFAEIARRAGIQYEVTSCPNHLAYNKLLASGNVDLVMDAGWDYSTAENMGYKLTSSYLSLALSQVSKIDNTGDIKKVAVPDGPILTEVSQSALFKDYSFKSCSTAMEAIEMVAVGSVDAAFVYAPDAQQYILDDIKDKFQVSVLPDVTINISIGCASADNYLLLAVLSKSADSVRDHFAQETVLNNLNKTHANISFLDYLYLHPLWAMGIFLIVLAALTVIIYQRYGNLRQREYSEALQKAKDEADKANAAKSTFLSSMSHDLRTPLNGIVGFTDIALREDDPDKKQEYLSKIKDSGSLLTDLVDDTLELSRIESGKMELTPVAVDGRVLCMTVVSAVHGAAEAKGIQLTTDFSGYRDGTWLIDRLKLQKVLLNLLSNAIKYTPAGGHVRLTVASLEPPEGGFSHRFTVEDDGIGMSEGFQEKMFEPFSQEHRPEAGTAMGTGLGLAIAKRIVDLMGGRIAVQSQVGKGTVFAVELPVKAAPQADGTPAEDREDEVTLAGRRILLCEDNQLNAEIAVHLLRDRGMEVDCVENGQAGVERFISSGEGEYAAVLMDIRMPVMNGYDAARAIRSSGHPDGEAIPIIPMSADAFEEDKRLAAEAGMNGYVTKPVDREQLYQTLVDVMGRSVLAESALGVGKGEPSPDQPGAV